MEQNKPIAIGSRVALFFPPPVRVWVYTGIHGVLSDMAKERIYVDAARFALQQVASDTLIVPPKG